MEISELTLADVDAMLRLCAVAGWNQTPADLRRLLTLEPQGCFAARDLGRLVGTTTTTTYGSALAWIGMVLVDPDHRRRGIATALLGAALEHLRRRGVSTIKLDATPDGRPVYERFGFVPETRLERWSGEAARFGANVPAGRWEDVAAADTAAFGLDRGRILRSILADSPYPPIVSRNERGELSGHVVARPGSRAAYVGPLIAAGLDEARELLGAALDCIGDGPVFIDVNAEFAGATDILRSMGFVPRRELLRMRLGPDREVGLSSRVFAIAAPELG